MTVAEWNACTGPTPMLSFLQGKISERKFRLFAAGCCRQLWGATADEATSAALAIVDQLAEAGTLRTWRGYVRVPAGQVVLDCGASDPLGPLSVGGEDAVPKQVADSNIPTILKAMLGELACRRMNPALLTHLLPFLTNAGLPAVQQAILIRDIVRYSLHPLRFRASWRTWNNGVCFKIAEGIYNERLFNQLPILADALEEAGCAEPDILNHCRQPGEHVRGCWVLDALLGKT
jgi:hypothetical protein